MGRGYIAVALRRTMSANQTEINLEDLNIDDVTIDDPEAEKVLNDFLNDLSPKDKSDFLYDLNELEDDTALDVIEEKIKNKNDETDEKLQKDYSNIDFNKIKGIWPDNKIIVTDKNSPLKSKFENLDKQFNNMANDIVNPLSYDFNQYSYKHPEYEGLIWAQAVLNDKLESKINKLKNNANDYLINKIDSIVEKSKKNNEKLNNSYTNQQIQEMSNYKEILSKLNNDGKFYINIGSPDRQDWNHPVFSWGVLSSRGRVENLTFIPNDKSSNIDLLNNLSSPKKYNYGMGHYSLTKEYDRVAFTFNKISKLKGFEKVKKDLNNVQDMALKMHAITRQIEYVQNDMYKKVSNNNEKNLNPDYLNQIINTKG